MHNNECEIQPWNRCNMSEYFMLYVISGTYLKKEW